MKKYQYEKISRIMNFLISEAKEQSTCHKRQVGCILMDENLDSTLSSGFNQGPVNLGGCKECNRKNKKPGEDSYLCKVVHAEVNCITNLSPEKRHLPMVMIVNVFPCDKCSMLIMNYPIKELYYKEEYYKGEDFKFLLKCFKKAKIKVEKII